MSPYAAAEKVKQSSGKFKTTISYKTIYNYIDNGLFPHLTNKHLPVKKNGKKRKYDEVRTATSNSKGTSISERDPKIDFREEYGHWEMDTVVGKQGTKEVLLVLTERMTEQEIIRKIKSKSQFCVVNELDKIERKMGSNKFRETFKTVNEEIVKLKDRVLYLEICSGVSTTNNILPVYGNNIVLATENGEIIIY